MTKIRCMCCHGVAQVAGSHEFKSLDKCKNGTFIETKAAGIPRIGGRSMKVIRIWDIDAKKFVPLIEN